MAITYVGAGSESAVATGSNAAPTYPTGLQAGDLILLWVTCSIASTWGNLGATSAFTRRLFNDAAGSSPCDALYYRISDGTESGAVTLNAPGGNNMGRMFAYRGVDTVNPFDTTDALFGSSVSVTNYDIPDQTSVTDHCAAVIHAASNSTAGTYTQPAGYTEIWDSTGGAVASAQSVAHDLDVGNAGSQGIRTIVRSAALRGEAEGVLLRPFVPSMTFIKTVTIG